MSGGSDLDKFDEKYLNDKLNEEEAKDFKKINEENKSDYDKRKVEFDLSKYANEWDAINMYNKKRYEEQLRNERNKNWEMRMRTRADLNNQIKQKIIRKREQELKNLEYDAMQDRHIQYLNSLDEKRKIEIKKRELKEKEERDKQLREQYMTKRINYLKNKLYEKELNHTKFQFVSKQVYEKKYKALNSKCLVIKDTPCTIIFQNIVNYMSGVNDIWGNGKNQLAIEVKSNSNEEKRKYTEKLEQMAAEKQKIDDKMLEIFTFDNGLKTGFEKVIGGLAKKIYHGKGPIEMSFLDTPNYDKNERKNRIYFNLDGEYFHVVKPILLRVELNRDICQGQLSMLIGSE